MCGKPELTFLMPVDRGAKVHVRHQHSRCGRQPAERRPGLALPTPTQGHVVSATCCAEHWQWRGAQRCRIGPCRPRAIEHASTAWRRAFTPAAGACEPSAACTTCGCSPSNPAATALGSHACTSTDTSTNSATSTNSLTCTYTNTCTYTYTYTYTYTRCACVPTSAIPVPGTDGAARPWP